jgi:hypothetical protein
VCSRRPSPAAAAADAQAGYRSRSTTTTVPTIAAAIADGVADLTPGPEGSASALRQSSGLVCISRSVRALYHSTQIRRFSVKYAKQADWRTLISQELINACNKALLKPVSLKLSKGSVKMDFNVHPNCKCGN